MTLSRFGYGAVGLVAVLGALALLFYSPPSEPVADPSVGLGGAGTDSFGPDADGGAVAKPEDPVEETPEQRRASILIQWRAALLHHNLRRFEPLNRSIENHIEEFREGLSLVAVNDPLPQPRAFAIRVLGRHKPTQARDLFMDRLMNDTAETVRSNAAWALGQAGFASDRELLEQAGKDDPSEMVRKAIREAISVLEN
jgi:hypothetical protein